jgi:hypothetical protein
MTSLKDLEKEFEKEFWDSKHSCFIHLSSIDDMLNYVRKAYEMGYLEAVKKYLKKILYYKITHLG